MNLSEVKPELWLSSYELNDPVVTFLRHNENQTFRVDDLGNTYLLRVHQPLNESMTGLQHTYDGLLEELKMLEALSEQTNLTVQRPLRNRDGELITILEQEGVQLHASLLTWVEGRDLAKADVAEPQVVSALARNLSDLHSFFHHYSSNQLNHRPSQNIAYNIKMADIIRGGVQRGLFQPSDAATIDKTINYINNYLQETENAEFGLIHGDLGLGNVLVTRQGDLAIIDYGFFGPGYELIDAAMGAMMIPADLRDLFLEEYFGKSREYIAEDTIQRIEGFMLLSIIGYYAFQIGNAAVHEWMQDRMPKLCAGLCQPFLRGERIFYAC